MSKSYKYKIYIVYGEDNLTLSSSGRSTMYDIKRAIAQRYEVPVANLEIRIGEDLRPFEMPESALLRNTGIESGETLTIIEKESLEDIKEPGPLPLLKYEQVPDSDGLIMIRRVIPADNSCLFNSVAYAVEDKSRESANYLRQIVASYIASDPEKYNELVLERSNEAYLEWIMDELNWGGAIEIDILSNHYAVEICVVNIQTMSISSFGADKQYKRRIYILYDGAHYDAIARNISEDMEENTDITVFSPRDKFAEDGVLMLARELHYNSSSLKIESSESAAESLSDEGMEERTSQNCYQQASKYNFDNMFNKMDALKET